MAVLQVNAGFRLLKQVLYMSVIHNEFVTIKELINFL